MDQQELTRRNWLRLSSFGLGSVAASWLLKQDGLLAAEPLPPEADRDEQDLLLDMVADLRWLASDAVTVDYRFERARTLASFGADFLSTWISPVNSCSPSERTRGRGESSA